MKNVIPMKLDSFRAFTFLQRLFSDVLEEMRSDDAVDDDLEQMVAVIATGEAN